MPRLTAIFASNLIENPAVNCMQQTPDLSPKLKRLIEVFSRELGRPFNTELRGGAEEPLYEPGGPNNEHACIHFTRDYFSSALHEIAHWCVAGEDRRQKIDYGYWYAPDGRTSEQQKQFETVEIVPQALEWIFSKASGARFRISADNLESQLAATNEFKNAVLCQVQLFCKLGLPQRACDFAFELAREFDEGNPLLIERYRITDI